MRQLTIDGRVINDHSDVYVIAEIGHNHGGSLDKCKRLFAAAKDAGADAVKLQKRDNKSLYTKAFYNSPYPGPDSYGATYGEHREALEFDKKEYEQLQYCAKDMGITFFATPFDIPSADLLHSLDMPAYKIASADLPNDPLIEHVSDFGMPMIISTGRATMRDIARCYALLRGKNFEQFAFLHCVSSYPNESFECNLLVISELRKVFTNIVIGWSDHYSGITAALSSYHYGAQIIEKHFTLRHTDKGTDHKLSLEPKKMRAMIGNLKDLYDMRGDGVKRVLEKEREPIRKMGKSLCLKHPIKEGTEITPELLAIRSPGGGLAPYKLEDVLGKIAICDLSTSDDFTEDFLK